MQGTRDQGWDMAEEVFPTKRNPRALKQNCPRKKAPGGEGALRTSDAEKNEGSSEVAAAGRSARLLRAAQPLMAEKNLTQRWLQARSFGNTEPILLSISITLLVQMKRLYPASSGEVNVLLLERCLGRYNPKAVSMDD